MTAILHTDIHREMDSRFAPEQVAEILKTMPIAFSFSEYDGNKITFQHLGKRILVDGIIQRWQGTEAHIELVAEVNQSLLTNRRRNTLIGLILGVAGILSYILIDEFRNLECVRTINDNCYEYMGFSEWDMTIMFFGLWFFVVIVIWLLHKFDPKLKKRWQAQQELGKVTAMIFDHIRQQEDP